MIFLLFLQGGYDVGVGADVYVDVGVVGFLVFLQSGDEGEIPAAFSAKEKIIVGFESMRNVHKQTDGRT